MPIYADSTRMVYRSSEIEFVVGIGGKKKAYIILIAKAGSQSAQVLQIGVRRFCPEKSNIIGADNVWKIGIGKNKQLWIENP